VNWSKPVIACVTWAP